jgi:hypothetical protein
MWYNFSKKKGNKMSNELLNDLELKAKIHEYESYIKEDDRDFIRSMFENLQCDDRYENADEIDRSVDGTAARHSADFSRESMQ